MTYRPRIVFISGASGTGKTLYARKCFNRAFLTRSYWHSGYDPVLHDSVIMDDADSSTPLASFGYGMSYSYALVELYTRKCAALIPFDNLPSVIVLISPFPLSDMHSSVQRYFEGYEPRKILTSTGHFLEYARI